MENNENLITIKPEKITDIKIVEITDENKEMLLGLRAVIDKDFQYDEKIESEVEKYSSEAGRQDGNRKAFIAMEDGHPIGYVEVILNIKDLDDLSQSEQYLKDRDYNLGELATLSRIGLISEKRGGGRGSKLIDQAKMWVKSTDDNKRGMFTDYLPETLGLPEFYKKNNFIDAGEFFDEKKKKMRRVAVCSF